MSHATSVAVQVGLSSHFNKMEETIWLLFICSLASIHMGSSTAHGVPTAMRSGTFDKVRQTTRST
jgi:hypothetical protein